MTLTKCLVRVKSGNDCHINGIHLGIFLLDGNEDPVLDFHQLDLVLFSWY